MCRLLMQPGTKREKPGGDGGGARDCAGRQEARLRAPRVISRSAGFRERLLRTNRRLKLQKGLSDGRDELLESSTANPLHPALMPRWECWWAPYRLLETSALPVVCCR